MYPVHKPEEARRSGKVFEDPESCENTPGDTTPRQHSNRTRELSTTRAESLGLSPMLPADILRE
ncbi:hypothetical protein I2494_15490 [Budviciaceae bacterium BWR-B9]|uniref:Uncharacterized protein n=1 Tax=Limnobaculum allomyrinae TaxID=2791986 RepID=A0ABS1ITK1_9GAMM|nr:hypothetical protein [Limnobaculum allomyrinae]MBV7692924.1 hypothetical protein [Limnobaculum sp. M2-1]